MIKKGQEAKVDEEDRATFEEVQKIVAEQEEKLKEWVDGPSTLSAVSCRSSAPIFFSIGENSYVTVY
jgi:hypothetical protein